jgi:hypothetical protein
MGQGIMNKQVAVKRSNTMGRPNPERAMLVLFPLITLSLFMVGVFFMWITSAIFPALGLIK